MWVVLEVLANHRIEWGPSSGLQTVCLKTALVPTGNKAGKGNTSWCNALLGQLSGRQALNMTALNIKAWSLLLGLEHKARNSCATLCRGADSNPGCVRTRV